MCKKEFGQQEIHFKQFPIEKSVLLFLADTYKSQCSCKVSLLLSILPSTEFWGINKVWDNACTYFRGQVEQFVRTAEASVSQKRQDDFLWQKNAEEGWLKITEE